MGKGLALPVTAGRAGGAKLEDDPRHLATILKLALSAGGDDNPFQQLGIDESIIFDVNDPSARGVARNAVERVLTKFADRVRVDPNGPVTVRKTQEGQTEVSFRYINLDTGNVNDFTLTF